MNEAEQISEEDRTAEESQDAGQQVGQHAFQHADESFVPADNAEPDADVEQSGPDDESLMTGTGSEMDVVIANAINDPQPSVEPSALLKAVVEAVIYITDEPLTAEQIAAGLEQPVERVKDILQELVAAYSAPDRGLSIRELAGGYKMSTKPEHHESIRSFVKKLQPPLKLSLAALETLAVVAYKQPITGPEIMEIRGVQGAGVLKTLLDRRLVAGAGRKNVLGKPMQYKTTREFLIQFGLNSLAELPTLKEFEELGRFALGEGEEGFTVETTAEPVDAAAQEDLLLVPEEDKDNLLVDTEQQRNG